MPPKSAGPGALTERLARLAADLDGPARPSPADIRAVAANLAALIPVTRDPRARDPDLEPAVRFDPERSFGEPCPPWPEGGHVPGRAPGPPGGKSGASPSGAAASAPGACAARQGPLSADIAAARAAGDPVAAALDIAAGYRERARARNAELNAFLLLSPPDHSQARPRPGPLCGAVVAVKDIVETAGLRTTGGSRLREEFVPERDAGCWARLRAVGALCLGKTNTHEFAAGCTNENEHFGPARNPVDPSRITGGSSGGSAAAVAAGLAAAALGTDTGGSVRIPAACCGLVGFKPTYGRVSRVGVFSLAWSLDHVGPLARTVRDAAMLFARMAGSDPADPTTVGLPDLRGADDLGLPRASELRGLRVGVPRLWLEPEDGDPTTGGVPVSAAVRAAFERALRRCRDLGAVVVDVDLGSADFATAVNRIIALPESAAWHAADLRSAPERYGNQVRGRLLAGRFIAAEAYLQGQRLRSLLCRRFAAVLGGGNGVHLIATPTLPTVAPAIGASAAEGVALLRFCAPFNVVGWPAVTLPCGVAPDGLPIGLQLAAGPYRDAELLAAAATVERALNAG